jgi:hypothetical protein
LTFIATTFKNQQEGASFQLSNFWVLLGFPLFW